ncbi:MAG: GNAT family N-acetyltransferase [Paludibacteraceae bacterium]
MLLETPNKKEYKLFCKKNKKIPLFLQPWWMDAVCKETDYWDVFLYKDKDEIEGVFVCYFVKKPGFKMVIQPQLTQYNGIWLNYDESFTENDKNHFEKKAITNLLTQLRNHGFDYFNQNFPLNFSNWLPFYWEGFNQTTRYTYQLSGIENPEVCFEKFSYAKQKQIRKAQKKLSVSFQLSAKDFYSHLSEYQLSRGQKALYTESFFLNLYDACKLNNQGEIIAVSGPDDEIHAALFIVWDNSRAYNLISTLHPKHKDSGASTLVVYEAIKYVSNKVQYFDFEGSMDKNIENSFSQFGTEQIPYFSIQKRNSITSKYIFPLFKL